MQEDMRLKLPAASEPEPERAEVRVIIGMDTQGDGEAAYVVFHPVPGTPLVIRPEDWMPKAEQPLALLPAEFHTAGVMEAAFRLKQALGIEKATMSVAAVEAFRQGHIEAQRRRDASRTGYEEADEVKVRRAAEDLIGHLGLFTEGVDWPSVDRFKALAG